MKEIKYTYKFKLKPTKEQEIKLNDLCIIIS